MALISIEGMEFFAYHGCFAEEQLIGAHFIVDFYLDVNTRHAEQSDTLHHTINYMSVYQVVTKEMEVKSHLLESVAHRILTSVVTLFPDIISAEVKIAKLNPSIGGKVDRVCVTLSTDDLTFDECG